MSIELDYEVGFDTKANPYLVCFCDQCADCDKCIMCKGGEGDQFHETDGPFSALTNGIKGAAKGIKGAAFAVAGVAGHKASSSMAGRNADTREAGMRDKHVKRQKYQNDTYNVFINEIHAAPNRRKLFSTEEFKKFRADWGLDDVRLKELDPQDIKTDPGYKALADKMISDAKSRTFKWLTGHTGRKMKYEDAMKELHEEYLEHHFHANVPAIVQYGQPKGALHKLIHHNSYNSDYSGSALHKLIHHNSHNSDYSGSALHQLIHHNSHNSDHSDKKHEKSDHIQSHHNFFHLQASKSGKKNLNLKDSKSGKKGFFF